MKKKKETSRKTMTLKAEYKDRLDSLAYKLAHQLDDRVTCNDIFYALVDTYLDDVEQVIVKKYHEEIF
jgi:hypothetical protein